MGNTPSTPKITSQDKYDMLTTFHAKPFLTVSCRAILDMKNQRDRLHQYQKKITLLTNREKEIARECLRSGDKQRALLALRKKKYQESLLTQTDKQLAQLEILTSDVEFALVQKDVLFGLQQGTSVLKQIHKEMGGIERVEMIMGESEEARAYQAEIDEMLGGRMSNQDEDEVEDELAALEAESQGRNKVEMPSTGDLVEPMPQAPKETPKERAQRRAKDREHNGQEALAA